jgi:hypothetical protein
MKKHICFLGIVLLLLSCESADDVIDADRIYSYYELKYDRNKDKTIVKAMLRLDGPEGTLVELTEPGEISFNGDHLDFNPENKEHLTTYAYLVDSGTFKYINSDGNTINNSTPKLGEISFPSINSISRSKDLIIKWIGDPVGENENVLLTLEGSERAASYLSSEQGDIEFIIPASEIRSLDKFGSGTFKLQRIYSKYINTGTATGASMTLRYITDGYVLFSN